MEELTRREFADLCLEAHQRRQRADEYLRPYVLTGAPYKWYETHPPTPFTPPAAGDWVRIQYANGWHGEPPKKWHRFSGSIRWRPSWDHAQLDTIDGESISAAYVAVSSTMPDSDVCKRCQRKAVAA